MKIFYVELSDGSIRKVEASSRKEAIKIAKSFGYKIYKITKDGGRIQYRGVPRQ